MSVVKNNAVHQYFEAQCLKTPLAPAVTHNGKSLSYGELNERANRLAHFISRTDNPERLTGICLERSLELAVSVLAILKAGHAYVPFDPEYPQERLAYMMEISRLPLLITNKKLSEKLPAGGARIILPEELEELINEESASNPGISSLKSDLAYVLFTSGSTGMPKGVAMMHGPLVNLIDWQNSQTNLGIAARTLQFAPVSFDVSFQEMFTTWSCGGNLFMIDDEMRLNAVSLLKFINEYKIERLFLPFIALQHLAEVADENKIYPLSLQNIITAGEQLRITKHIANFFTALPNCKLHNHYGPTETHVVTAYTLTGTPDAWLPLPPIGTPVSNTEIHLLDESMKPVMAGEAGEIYVAGAAVARGYLNRADLTSERFISNPFSKDKSDRLYKTGDLARTRPDGNIEYLGRIDGQVKVRGYRIEPGEIEIMIGKFKGIKQVVVIAREDEPGDKRLVAYLILQEGLKINSNELRKFLNDNLPDYMVPSSFVTMDLFPRTPSGKIDTRSLPVPDNKRPELNTLFVEPAGSFEKALASLWRKLLRIDKVGLNDNFFDLGGNSLLALQTIAKIHQEQGIDIPVVKLYQHPTIGGISDFINKQGNKQSAADLIWERKTKIREAGASGNAVEDGIAVIGMAGRFPGADNVKELWENLVQGKETTSFFKREELDPSIDPDIVNDPSYVAARGIINDADKFDASFFGINPRIAELTDPQQRIFLEVAWEALEDAGYTANKYNGLIGVFAGMGNNTYFPNNIITRKDLIDKVGSFQVMVANEKDYIATRIAYELNLKGPGISVHTGCSTSLVGVTLAFESLKNNHCDMALAGGISITAPVNSGQVYNEGGMFSLDGHTRTFDASATGTVFSDGTGIVVLKRYRDAVADGDTIYAVIRGAAMNNDGSEKASFTAPSVEGQAAVIAMAQSLANTEPSTISYVETHGTATPLGDPIEVEALTQAFRSKTDAKQFCALGSIKTNFGHLTAAAGVAGLIKTVLALRHKKIPANLHFSKPNPAINFEESPFYVNTSLSEWKAKDWPRRAGVSSFGVGGTNVHVVIEETPEQEKSGIARSKNLILLSAKSKPALDTATENIKKYIENNSGIHIPDLAYTLQTGRNSFNYRRFVIGGDQVDTIQKLNLSDPKSTASKLIEAGSPQIVFMFPGQGAQYVNMGRTFYRDEIIFKEAVDRCCSILEPLMGVDLKKTLYPSEGDSASAEKSLMETFYTQPALFTIGYALSKLWMSWGIQPSVFVGHSIGEFVGACLAGVFSLDEALFLVANRGKLMQDLPHGSMLSVRMPAADVEKKISGNLSIAAVNGPSLCVVAGNTEEVTLLQKLLEKEEVICKPLHTSHAFHSPMMDPIVEPFLEKVKQVKLMPPQIPFISTVTAQWIKDSEATDPLYWANHLRATVRFAEGIQTLWTEKPGYILLECGPRTTAATLARQQAADLKKQVAISSLGDSAEGDAEWNAILFALGQLWLNGVEPDWNNFYALEKRKKISLPTYPFEHKRYWIDPLPVKSHKEPVVHDYMMNPVIKPLQTELTNGQQPIQVNMNTTTITRQHRIIADLKEVMEEASGIELANADTTTSFLELGLDSLFLTQAALTISKKYGVKVTFRQLNEDFSSFDALSAFIDRGMPEGAMPEIKATDKGAVHQPQVAQQTPVYQQPQPMQNPYVMPGQPGSMEWMMMQQLQMMQQQIAMMQNSNANGIIPAPIPASPVQQATPAVVSQTPQKINPAELTVSPDEAAELKKPFGAIARIEKGRGDQLNPAQRKWLDDFISRYTNKTKKSKQYTQEHRAHLADPRVVTGFKANIKELIYQPVVDKSLGSRIWDIDGNEYVDVLNGFGSNMFGHNNPIILRAIEEQMKKGYELGPQHPLAGEVAKMICEMTNYDRAGFCNTGSEAVLGAMRIARTITGRQTIVIFSGSYHGINDEVIVRGTKKLRSVPASAGIPVESVQNVLVLDYGTQESLDIIRSRAQEFAAVMVEPVQSRRADFHPKEFLQALRKITTDNGCLFIFDEVITGFRTMPGGAQEYFGIKADIGTYGKVVGGGMPIGVIAGKREFMDSLDGGFWKFGDASVPEVGVTYFAGTFVRHPFALAAAKASLDIMKKEGPGLQKRLNAMTARLTNEINNICLHQNAPFHIVNFGSLFKMKWDAEPAYCELIYVLLRDKGIHIYDGFPCFLTMAHTESDVDFIIEKYKDSILEMQVGGFFEKPTGNGKAVGVESNTSEPPVPGAKLGKDPQGNPGWFIPDPKRPGKYLQVK